MKRLKSPARFVLCVRTNGSEDLEQRKVYQILPDRTASREGYVRVVDESGEDYLYPAEYFVPVKLPAAIAHELELPSDATLQTTVGAPHRLAAKMRVRAARG